MNPIVLAMRRPVTTLMLVVALVSGFRPALIRRVRTHRAGSLSAGLNPDLWFPRALKMVDRRTPMR